MNRLAALAILFAACGSALAQQSPEEALKSFTLANGLQIELFASEPMFTNPTCFDIDHKGRVWVCESVNYRTHLRKTKLNRPEGDRLVVLEDTDGDGKADKSHTFYQAPDFLAPLGICVAPEPSRDRKGAESLKVYVCHSPHIYVFEDKDGDLKADDKPKVLLTGFKGYDHDHGVHGIHFGPDGKLYFSVGDTGVDGLKSASGDASAPRVWKTNQTDCQAGTIWRCDPDGKNLELLAHNFRNQYEPAVNSFGTMFVSDNDDDGNQQTRICYVMYGGNYGYWPRGKGESHWHEEQPGVVHKALRTGFGSPTGLCWYEGTLLNSTLNPRPSTLEGLLLHTDAGPREVRCFVVKPKGAGYELDKINLVTSSDNWFRPSDVCVAPDGSVFVADWYDPGVGGHGMGDTTRGRIYRLTPKGHKGYKVPQVDPITNDGIAAALESPCLATRQMAVHLIQSLKWDKAVKILAAHPDEIERVAVTARFMRLVGQLADDLNVGPTPGSMKHDLSQVPGIRTLRDRFGDFAKLGEDKASPWFREIIDKDSIAVRRELLLALHHTDPGFAKRHILQLAAKYDGQDHFYLAAIGIAVGTDPKRREVILADFEKHFPEWTDKVAKLVWELRPPGVIKKLGARLADPKVPAAHKVQMLEVLSVTQDESAGQALLGLLAGDCPAELRNEAVKQLVQYLPSKWAGLKKSPDLAVVVTKLGRAAETMPQAFELIVAGEVEPEYPRLTTVAQSETLPADIVRAAIRALPVVKKEEGVKALDWVLTYRPALRTEAVQALGKMQTPAALKVLEDLVMKTRAHTAAEAVEALAGSRAGTVWLLDSHAKKELPEALLAEAGRILRNSQFPDLRNKALIAFPAPGKLDPKKLPAIATLAKRKGDAERGHSLFAKDKDLGCARCHSLRGSGGNIGPDLSMIGKKGSRENLFESLIDPDKAVADQYIQWVVLNQQGLPLSGLLIEDTPQHVILRDAQGKDNKIAKDDIANRMKSPKSIMPSDVVAFITEQDLIDMVEFLATLKTPALTVDSWRIAGPFGSDLDKQHIPEAKIDLAATYAGKSGKVAWRTVKPDATGYVDLRAHYGPAADQIVSYLYREIESPADQEATILIGTDDGCKLWVNGELALSHRRHEAASPERDIVKVKLKAGLNKLLLKINNGDGPHGFYFAVMSEQELKLPQRK